MNIPFHKTAVLNLLLILTAGAKEYAVFDVIGDSVSAGENPEQTNFGWVDMLFGESAGSYPAQTNNIEYLWPGIAQHNSAYNGSTAADWAADADGKLTGVMNRNPDLVIVYLGGNDIGDFIDDGNLSQAELESYHSNMTTIVENLKANVPAPDIVMLDYYDLFDGYSSNLIGTLQYSTNTTEAATAINAIIAEVAASNGCYMVDGIYDRFMHHCYGEELGDTNHQLPDYVRTPLAQFDIHPVTAGHNQIYELVYAKLNYLKQYAAPEQWMDQYGLTNYFTDAGIDHDNDGYLTWQEYIAGTDPTNSTSVFRPVLIPAVPDIGNIITWDPIPDRLYSVHYSTNLPDGFQPLETNLFSNGFLDSVNTNAPTYYQMDVRLK